VSKIEAEFHYQKEFETFLRNLGDPRVRVAAAQGLNEHAAEQRRLSVTGIAAYTGVPKGRVSGATTVIKASPEIGRAHV
jgi:hypothetical protein